MVAKRVKKYLPASDKVSEHKLLRWLGPTLTKPSLWQINRRSISLGLAIGVFWGFLIPLAQIPFAAVVAVFMRANLPMAMASTLVTNPFTFAPVYFLAYQFGDWLLGDQSWQLTEEMLAQQMSQISVTSMGWIERIGDVAAPLFTGLAIFACAGAVLGYFAVSVIWRLAVVMRYRKRQRRAVSSL